MDLHILSKKLEDGHACYLCEATLEEYISELPEDYYRYDIQRGIESNVYLDNLIDTVLKNRHIPPIVLVVENNDYQYRSDDVSAYKSLKIRKFKILDGLQRTCRLKIIWDTILLFQKLLKKGEHLCDESRFSLSKKYARELYEINSSAGLLFKIIHHHKNNTEPVEYCFQRNEQWFEVWTDLPPREQVHKMLLLNAGHKQLKVRHQLELLFLNLIPRLQRISDGRFTLIREKEKNSAVYSRYRKQGQFHFSHIISAILSFMESKPVTPDTHLLQKLQKERTDTETRLQFFDYDYEFFENLVFLLTKLDNVSKEYNETWLGKESTLTGIFGALGKYEKESSLTVKALFDKVADKLQANKKLLNLEEYYEAFRFLETSKVRIGSVHRKTVFSGFYDFLVNMDSDDYTSINWQTYFEERHERRVANA
ncbi:MAG: hypothetical protein DRI57_20360 [Deltaproteobacteria bacterium]|nr:MAG: hypothetical protein DRI57_20360 [Deltaproteobacteria bacterium]